MEQQRRTRRHRAGHADRPADRTGNRVHRRLVHARRNSARCKLTIGYYIDALTVAMFAMVTLIATCIHFYAIGYMHDELHDVTDHEVTLADGHICTAPAASIASSNICRCSASACWGW